MGAPHTVQLLLCHYWPCGAGKTGKFKIWWISGKLYNGDKKHPYIPTSERNRNTDCHSCSHRKIYLSSTSRKVFWTTAQVPNPPKVWLPALISVVLQGRTFVRQACQRLSVCSVKKQLTNSFCYNHTSSMYKSQQKYFYIYQAQTYVICNNIA